ncbi:MAG: hypothetical protein HOQ02_11845 [Lysobacter sp.]|nr:hypothetical protein [Lysobacter sp.]
MPTNADVASDAGDGVVATVAVSADAGARGGAFSYDLYLPSPERVPSALTAWTEP